MVLLHIQTTHHHPWENQNLKSHNQNLESTLNSWGLTELLLKIIQVTVFVTNLPTRKLFTMLCFILTRLKFKHDQSCISKCFWNRKKKQNSLSYFVNVVLYKLKNVLFYVQKTYWRQGNFCFILVLYPQIKSLKCFLKKLAA